MSMIEAAEARLWATVNTRTGGRPLDDACDAALYNFIRAGIARLEHADQLEDSDRIALAEQNLIRFVDAMLEGSHKAPVPETAFWQTRGHLCPLWPFCGTHDNGGGGEESPWG